MTSLSYINYLSFVVNFWEVLRMLLFCVRDGKGREVGA